MQQIVITIESFLRTCPSIVPCMEDFFQSPQCKSNNLPLKLKELNAPYKTHNFWQAMLNHLRERKRPTKTEC